MIRVDVIISDANDPRTMSGMPSVYSRGSFTQETPEPFANTLHEGAEWDEDAKTQGIAMAIVRAAANALEECGLSKHEDEFLCYLEEQIADYRKAITA